MLIEVVRSQPLRSRFRVERTHGAVGRKHVNRVLRLPSCEYIQESIAERARHPDEEIFRLMLGRCDGDHDAFGDHETDDVVSATPKRLDPIVHGRIEWPLESLLDPRVRQGRQTGGHPLHDIRLHRRTEMHGSKIRSIERRVQEGCLAESDTHVLRLTLESSPLGDSRSRISFQVSATATMPENRTARAKRHTYRIIESLRFPFLTAKIMIFGLTISTYTSGTPC